MSNGANEMTEAIISREDILRSTLFHIQMSRCQYIDDFPVEVTNILEKCIVKEGIEDFSKIRRKLYRINTSFFRINKIEKRKFFDGLFRRIENLLQQRR